MKSDVTRKNDVYAFATSRSRAKNSVRVCACQMPIAAKREPSATSVTTSARGSQAVSGERQTIPRPATNGKMKNASAMPPSRSSHVHRNEVEANVTKAASGSASRNGGAGGCSPRRIRYASANGCRREDEVQREQQERVLVAERDREPERRSGEERDGGRCRVAGERNGAEADHDDADCERGERRRLLDQELDVAPAHERHGEPAGGGSQEREPDDREDTAPRDERQDGAERADERSDLSGIRVLHDAERYVACAARLASYPSCRSVSATSGRIRSIASGFWSRHFSGRGSVSDGGRRSLGEAARVGPGAALRSRTPSWPQMRSSSSTGARTRSS